MLAAAYTDIEDVLKFVDWLDGELSSLVSFKVFERHSLISGWVTPVVISCSRIYCCCIYVAWTLVVTRLQMREGKNRQSVYY